MKIKSWEKIVIYRWKRLLFERTVKTSVDFHIWVIVTYVTEGMLFLWLDTWSGKWGKWKDGEEEEKKSSKESRKQCIVVDVPIIMLYPGRLSLHFIQYGRGYARIHRCKSRLWKRREKWNWPHHDPNTASDSNLGCTLV